jgi:RHS repeat-associated protein
MTTDDQVHTLKYDAWNRLVAINGGDGQSVSSYTFDALGRRIVENGTDLYYSNRGQVVEEAAGRVTQTQYVWSPFYVNELVQRTDSTTDSGSLDRTIYVQQDANYNVTSVTNTSGVVKARYVYDPYGTVTALTASGLPGGDVYGMEYLFQGGRLDVNTGMYHFGLRDYSPTLGRWVQQDPFGGAYIDGANLYQLERDRPVALVDPRGTDGETIAQGFVDLETYLGTPVAGGFAEVGGQVGATVAEVCMCPARLVDTAIEGKNGDLSYNSTSKHKVPLLWVPLQKGLNDYWRHWFRKARHPNCKD